MRTLITGKGTSGSFQIRGVQLGAAIGAHVEPQLLTSKADLVIGVKRVSTAMAEAYRGRLIWDIVDAHPQPHGNEWDEATCKRWLAGEVARLKPVGMIAATNQMAVDLAGFCVPVLWLPHHHRPFIERNPIRKEVRLIGYEGSPGYIESWRPAIERECKRIGAKFIVNPPRLADLDIVLALRGSAGYAPRNWKSNVKGANAHGSGTPLIAGRESGYLEMANGMEEWADTPDELSLAVEAMMSRGRRQHVQEQFIRSAFTLEQAAERLNKWLMSL